jgi:hypothetical protein
MQDEPKLLPPPPGGTAEMAADSEPVARADSVVKPPRTTPEQSRARRMHRTVKRT